MVFLGRWDCISLVAFCIFGFYLGFKLKVSQFFVIYQIFLLIHAAVLFTSDRHETAVHTDAGYMAITPPKRIRELRQNPRLSPKPSRLHSIGVLPPTDSPDFVTWNPQDIKDFYPTIFRQYPSKFDADYKNPCWSQQLPDEHRGKSLRQRVETDDASNLVCLPYVYILGMPKCGTSDLYERMIKHPNIYGGDRKEIRWFTRGEFATSKLLPSQRLGAETELSSFTTRFQAATELIKENNADIIVDGGPHTLWWSTQEPDGSYSEDTPIPQILKQMQPSAKFIVILQNPIDRSYSDYNFIGDDMKPVSESSHHSKTPKQFHERISIEVSEFNDCIESEAAELSSSFDEVLIWFRAAQICAHDRHQFAKSGWGRISIGMYAMFIEKWLDYFPADQFLIVTLDDLKNELATTMRTVLAFLNVGEIEESSGYWSSMMSTKVANAHKFERDDMLPETRELLAHFYEPFNEAMAKMMGDDKFLWTGKKSIESVQLLDSQEKENLESLEDFSSSPEFVERVVHSAIANTRNHALSVEALCTAVMALDVASVELLIQKYNVHADIRNHMDADRNSFHCLSLVWVLADATAKSHIYTRLNGENDWLSPYLFPPEGEPDGNGVTRDIVSRMKGRVLKIADILYDAGAKIDEHDSLHMTALDYASHGGLEYLVSWMLDKGVDVNRIGSQGGTALHHAGFQGHAEVASMLIEAGADVHYKDAHGTSFMELAMEPGVLTPWLTKQFFDIDQRLPKEISIDPFIAKTFGSGGWNEDESFEFSFMDKLGECDVDQYYASEITSKQLFDKYIARNRPVLIRGLLHDSDGWNAYSRDNLLEDFGDMAVHVSDIPYNKKFGSSQGEESTLGAYIRTMDKKSQSGGDYPWYVFKGNPVPQESERKGSIVHSTLVKNSKLILDAEDMIANKKDEQTFVNIQWAIGSSGTGAPIHFHNSAWNMLFYGRKKWIMFPPDTMLMSNIQIKQWIETYLVDDKTRRFRPVTCTQHSGDVMYVPESWAHGVINLQDSVAVASEVRGSMYRIHPLPRGITHMPDEHESKQH